MTETEWLAKAYPIKAHELEHASDEACLNHCLNKWKGAKKENLPEGYFYSIYTVYEDSDSVEPGLLTFDSDTCALCQKYSFILPYTKRCTIPGKSTVCPIIRFQGKRCDEGGDSAWNKSEFNPEPMIKLLEDTLNFISTEER